MTDIIYVTAIILNVISLAFCIGVKIDTLLDTSPWMMVVMMVVLAAIMPILSAILSYMRVLASHGDRNDAFLGMGTTLAFMSAYMHVSVGNSDFLDAAKKALGLHADMIIWWYATVQLFFALGLLAIYSGSVISRWMKAQL